MESNGYKIFSSDQKSQHSVHLAHFAKKHLHEGAEGFSLRKAGMAQNLSPSFVINCLFYLTDIQ